MTKTEIRTTALNLLTEAEALSVEWSYARGGAFLMSFGKLCMSLSSSDATNFALPFPSNADQLSELITAGRGKEAIDMLVPVLRSLEEQTRDNQAGNA